MKLSVKNSIYQAILHGKWLDISYLNASDKITNYYIGVQNIDVEGGRLFCDIFNPFLSTEIIQDTRPTYIYFEKIRNARILEHSYYETPEALLNRLSNDKTIGDFLETVTFDNNILHYLSDCYRLDNDPFLEETIMVDGIDLHTLSESGSYPLDDQQFQTLLDRVFKKPKEEAEIVNRYQTLAINRFSIDINDKQYVVAYRALTLDFKNKALRMADHTSINKSFLITESKRVTLGRYLDMMSPDDFCEQFDANAKELIDLIKENFKEGERVNTRPTIFFLKRNCLRGVDEAFEAIHAMDREDKLPIPIKAFFGRKKRGGGSSKEAEIVVYDRNKINIDQMRVVYNAMVNRITYVKGPPGTGKTETIFNVLLSAFMNDKTVLVCSNNNHPVSDIYRKMDGALTIKRPFADNKETVLFPMIRLGNNEEMEETIKKLKEVLAFVSKRENIRLRADLTEASKKRSLSCFAELRQLLMDYEDQIDLAERVSTLKKIRQLTAIGQINEKLDAQIAAYSKKLQEAKPIQDQDVLRYAVSASEDKNFQNCVYYSALERFQKLKNDTYKELREIIAITDPKEAVRQLNKYLKDDANLRRFIAVFPIVLCTNLSCDKLGSPKPQFDLVIMDESGQCNMATSLIPIVRGTDLLLVGDTNQLQPVTVIEENVNDELKIKYGISDEYDYIHNSILSLMLRKDNNSKSILLSHHYRCGKKIASFVNQRFYEKQLKLLNKESGELIYLNVKNTFNPGARNSYKEEAAQIARLIHENKYKDVGIITPFVNQAALVNEYLARLGITDVKAGTVHTLQGSEKSTIIMSAALSPRTGKKTMEWIKNNHELINVAVTRAKDRFVFVGDKEAIEALSGSEQNDLRVLSDYVYNNGEIVVPQSETTISYDFSNDSKNEKDFFDTVQPYFNRRGSKFRIRRNVPVSEAIKPITPEDVKRMGKKEFDLVVEVSGGIFNRNYRTIVVFEIDGGEHVGSKRTAALDRQKEEICKKFGIKLIRIPNSAVKDYESIISLFEFVIKDLPSMDQAYKQMSLFEEEAPNA